MNDRCVAENDRRNSFMPKPNILCSSAHLLRQLWKLGGLVLGRQVPVWRYFIPNIPKKLDLTGTCLTSLLFTLLPRGCLVILLCNDFHNYMVMWSITSRECVVTCADSFTGFGRTLFGRNKRRLLSNQCWLCHACNHDNNRLSKEGTPSC